MIKWIALIFVVFMAGGFCICPLSDAAEKTPGQGVLAETLKTPEPSMSRMAVDDQAEARAVINKTAETANQLTIQRKAILKQKQVQELKTLNILAMSRIEMLKASLKMVPKFRGMEIIVPPSRIAASSSTPASPVRISGLNPQPVTLGQTLSILGEGFGTRTGRVSLNIENIWVSLPVSRWQDTMVVVTLPTGVVEIVGAQGKSARIEVHHAEAGAGSMTLRLEPDISRITPNIEFLPKVKVKPGEILFIEGSHFSARKGKVCFTHVSSSGAPLAAPVEGIVDHWDDTVIAVHLREDLEGYPFDAIFSVDVENRDGLRSNSRTVVFEPSMDVEVLVDAKQHKAYHGRYCNSRAAKPVMRGYVTFPGLHLQNGWRLTGSHLKAYASGYPGGSCVYALRPPQNHTNFLETGINITNRDGACMTWCEHTIEIEGPKGLTYQQDAVEVKNWR